MNILTRIWDFIEDEEGGRTVAMGMAVIMAIVIIGRALVTQEWATLGLLVAPLFLLGLASLR